jgi:hypothetical protein
LNASEAACTAISTSSASACCNSQSKDSSVGEVTLKVLPPLALTNSLLMKRPVGCWYVSLIIGKVMDAADMFRTVIVLVIVLVCLIDAHKDLLVNVLKNPVAMFVIKRRWDVALL